MVAFGVDMAFAIPIFKMQQNVYKAGCRSIYRIWPKDRNTRSYVSTINVSCFSLENPPKAEVSRAGFGLAGCKVPGREEVRSI